MQVVEGLEFLIPIKNLKEFYLNNDNLLIEIKLYNYEKKIN